MITVYVIGAIVSLCIAIAIACAWLYEPACSMAVKARINYDPEVETIAGLFAMLFHVGGWLSMGVFLALLTLAVLTQVGRL